MMLNYIDLIALDAHDKHMICTSDVDIDKSYEAAKLRIQELDYERDRLISIWSRFIQNTTGQVGAKFDYVFDFTHRYDELKIEILPWFLEQSMSDCWIVKYGIIGIADPNLAFWFKVRWIEGAV